MLKVLDKLYKESLNYSTIEKMESLVQGGDTLEALPVQPLFFALKELPLDQVSLYLDKLSPEQRESLLDIDLWIKDKIDVVSFEEWVLAYAQCPNENMRYEFIQREQFLLYLKGRFGIYTFDVEDPLYPDHDNYFLTEDNQLLIEYDEEFLYVAELKLLIGELYDVMGVEGAYTYLFKMISDSFLISLEDNYKAKVRHLSDHGIVDYFEALKLLSPFPSASHIDLFLKKKEPVVSYQATEVINDSLNDKYLVKVKDSLDATFAQEFALIEDQKQFDWIRINFVRLMNAKMSMEGKLETSMLAIQKTSKELIAYLQLGLEYIRPLLPTEESVFSRFGFDDIYKVGSSLVHIEKKKVDSAISQYPKGMENFWGQTINNGLENLLETPVQVGKFSEKAKIVSSLALLEDLKTEVQKILSLLPVVHQFYKTFYDLQEQGNVSDTYYLNYTMEEIEFEAVILSTLFNFILGSYQNEDHQKRLGIRVQEFQKVLVEIFGSTVFEINNAQFKQHINHFVTSYGLDALDGFEAYLCEVIEENLSGYEFDHLSYDDYKHVGGIIFFNEA